MATTTQIPAMATTGQAQRGNDQGSTGRLVGLIAAVALGLSLLTGGIIGQLRDATPAAPHVQAAEQVSAAASERELNLVLEQNALPEITTATAMPDMLPVPANFFGEDH